MNATPDKAEGDKTKRPAEARRETLKKNGIAEPEMPPCDAQYLVSYLWEVGPTLGEGPITHTELAHWQDNTGIDLDAWEARVLKRLSLEYLAESHRARAPDCPAPWGVADKVLASINLKASMRELAKP